MREVTALELRNIVEKAISTSIELHRSSRASTQDKSYNRPSGAATDEEIDDFIASNSLLDEETQEQLMDPGLLGFSARTARASEAWLRKFRRNVTNWAESNSWLGADLLWTNWVVLPRAVES